MRRHMIDPPPPTAPLEVWEAFRRELGGLPAELLGGIAREIMAMLRE
ncbi:MAG TPA: hypothetical protein VEB64_09440 [Azospirillaceae bacterium]|nr:hypothetical protein [Azospirillaceae bacterium]